MEEPARSENELNWNRIYLAVVVYTLAVFGALWWFSQLFV